MTPAEIALRHRYTTERSWTAERVCAAICVAWKARPRTTEHSEIMAWPTMFLPIDQDARSALHMVGLNASAPLTYPLTTLVSERLRWSWNKFCRARERGCEGIAEALNNAVQPLILVARPST